MPRLAIDEPTFWRVWKRLQDRLPGRHVPHTPYDQIESPDDKTQLDQDLAFLLSASQHIPALEDSLRCAEARIEAARAAYAATPGRTASKQAAACHALGLTGAVGPKSTDRDVLWRWVDLTRPMRQRTATPQRSAPRASTWGPAPDKAQALEALGKELGIKPESAGRRLRRIYSHLERDIKDYPDSPWVGLWRLYIEMLDTEPARIPIGFQDGMD